MTGHREHPSVQQQQTQPQKSHFTFTGRVFLRMLFTRITVALYSSGATRDTKPFGNSASNLLLRPNLQNKIYYAGHFFTISSNSLLNTRHVFDNAVNRVI
jgi:hypothetical protein